MNNEGSKQIIYIYIMDVYIYIYVCRPICVYIYIYQLYYINAVAGSKEESMGRKNNRGGWTGE